MSFNQRKTLNTRPQTIKTRLSFYPDQASLQPNRRKSSEVPLSKTSHEVQIPEKRLKPENSSTKNEVSPLIKKSQAKNKELENQLLESLSKFKSANQEYLNLNEIVENEIGELHKDIQVLHQEFRGLENQFLTPPLIKSLFSSPSTATSKKKTYVKNDSNFNACRLVQSLQREVSELKKRLEIVESEYEYMGKQKMFPDFRNMMTTAETIPDDSSKGIECKVCTLF
jgi:molecular chaperone GrpE (heat shock protein)